MSKGRRSAKKLSELIKNLEVLGLVRRDNELDAVVVIDPDGLLLLGENPADLIRDRASGVRECS